jgi:hypothetical protein
MWRGFDRVCWRPIGQVIYFELCLRQLHDNISYRMYLYMGKAVDPYSGGAGFKPRLEYPLS